MQLTENLDVAYELHEVRTGAWGLRPLRRTGTAPAGTSAALRALAKRCPRLRSLSLPLDTARCAQELEPRDNVQEVRQEALERLLVGPPPAPAHVAAFVRGVLAVFPRVREIECASAETPLCVDVHGAHALDVEHPKGTSDGFADGQ